MPMSPHQAGDSSGGGIAPSPVSRKALVLALDGASFSVIEPMIADGRLPNLASWMKNGSAGPLRSTIPPVTFPAWSSFMTGLSPGEHGIFDFTQKFPGEYRIRFVNATDRHGSSIFERVSSAGGRVLVLGMPATYPPESVSGLLVAGFDAPVSAATDSTSASDPNLYRRIADRVGPWMRPEIDESATGGDFHERAVHTLLDRIKRKKRFALESLRTITENARGHPDLVVIVFSESDTVGHHYWRDHDPASPRHDAAADRVRRSAVESVYSKLDEACGEIRREVGEDALCIVVSDHGMGGAARCVVHLNRYLEECGLLARQAGGGIPSRAARWARDTAIRLLPAGVVQAVFRRARGPAARIESSVRFGGFEWAKTLAFSEEANTQPGVWINLAGREARGCVTASAYEATRDRVIAALLDWKLPDGGSIVRRAVRREDVYTGAFTERAPDIVVELELDRGYGLSLVPTPWDERGGSVHVLEENEFAGGRGRGMNGIHQPEGIFVTTEADEIPRALSDVAPWLLERMGVGWESTSTHETPRRDYTPEEDARIAERLRALGYLE